MAVWMWRIRNTSKQILIQNGKKIKKKHPKTKPLTSFNTFVIRAIAWRTDPFATMPFSFSSWFLLSPSIGTFMLPLNTSSRRGFGSLALAIVLFSFVSRFPIFLTIRASMLLLLLILILNQRPFGSGSCSFFLLSTLLFANSRIERAEVAFRARRGMGFHWDWTWPSRLSVSPRLGFYR